MLWAHEPGAPVLDQYDLILKELVEYHDKGGESLLDCQPQGCGRDGNQLLALSKASGVNMIACTGFHRKKYYPQDYWLWEAPAQKISEFLSSDLEHGFARDTRTPTPVKAGFIKDCSRIHLVRLPSGRPGRRRLGCASRPGR